MNSTKRNGKTRRRRIIGLLTVCVAAFGGHPRAAETQVNNSYYPLTGAAAWRFLIGNTAWAPPVEVDSGVGRSAKYFADENTALTGERDGRVCSVNVISFHENSYCSKLNMAGSSETCLKEHVIVPRGINIGKAKVGEPIGYLYPNIEFLPKNGVGQETPTPDSTYAVLKGNVTGCPRLGASQPPKQLELPASRNLVAWKENEKSKPSSGPDILRLLIGNSVLWPSSRDAVSAQGYDGSASRHYYSPDGYVFRADYDLSWKILGVAQSRWKIINGRFCLQDSDNHGAFSACDPITIVPVRAPSGRVRLHTYFDERMESAAFDPGAAQPGIIEQGNPVGFISDKK